MVGRGWELQHWTQQEACVTCGNSKTTAGQLLQEIVQIIAVQHAVELSAKAVGKRGLNVIPRLQCGQTDLFHSIRLS